MATCTDNLVLWIKTLSFAMTIGMLPFFILLLYMVELSGHRYFLLLNSFPFGMALIEFNHTELKVRKVLMT